MWFKNLTVFGLQEPLTVAADSLAAGAFRPCLSQEASSNGWVAPLGALGESLVHEVSGCQLISLQTEEKVLPAAVVGEVVAERAQDLEAREQRPVRRSERSKLRDEVLLELLPRAFSRRRVSYAYLDPAGSWLIIDGASAKAITELTERLRRSLGSLPIEPWSVRESPAAVMSGWLRDEALPPGFVLTDECELRDADGVVRCRGQELLSDEIRSHLDAGKQVTRLGLVWRDRLSFVLAEDLAIRRLRFLDLVQEELDELDSDDAAALFDAECSLMIGELRQLLPDIQAAFGGAAAAV